MSRWLAGALLMLALGLSVGAGAEPVLKVYAEDYPPYNYPSAAGPAGPNAKRVQALLKRAGLVAAIEFQPWARAYRQAVLQDDALVFSMHRTPEREQDWLWLAELSAEPNYLFRLATREDLKALKLEDVAHYRISVIRNSSSQEFLHKLGVPQSRIEGVTDLDQNLRKLVAGRVDLIAAQATALDNSARNLAIKPASYAPALRLNDFARLYLAANRRLDPVLRSRLEQALAAMQADGSWARAGE
ncbi:MAG: transporter substrate-binding domain-containing protein [Gammaproteobacteria bacterium]|nr:transporter substrate-binding domain-containing protein [Gammaproteobacteria bacterium]